MEDLANANIPIPLLQHQLLGNSVLQWFISIGIFLVVFFGMVLLRRLFLRIFARVADHTRNEIDDIFVGAIRKTNLFLVAVIGLVVASYPLELPAKFLLIRSYILSVALILQLALYANAILEGFLIRARSRQHDSDESAQTAIMAIKYISRVVLWSIVLLIVLDNLGVNISAMVAGLGVGGIALALAVQSILGDAFSFVAIIFDKPFEVGDFLVVDDKLGTVQRIGLKTTRVKALQGEEIVFSNNDLLKSRIQNFKKMRERRIVFSFGVTYQTSADQLEQVPGMVKEIIDSIEAARFDRAHFARYGAYSLDFEVVYFITTGDYYKYMDAQQLMNLKLFRKFEEEGIEFAYPTQTLFVSRENGKTESPVAQPRESTESRARMADKN